MKLSEINVSPLYPITIPSTKKKAKYRPFLVKEERALLAAQESEDLNVMLITLQNVVKACIEPSAAVDEMTSFDIEYVFTLIRAKSVGEYSDLTFRCDHCDTPESFANVRLDLRKVEVVQPESISPKIKLSDSITVLMKYPTMNELIEVEALSDDKDKKLESIKSCIVSIFVEDQVYNVSEEPAEELSGFMESLTSRQFKMLEEFIDNIPSAQIKVNYKCPVCGNYHNKAVKGLNNFF